jgi:hypothetical protein
LASYIILARKFNYHISPWPDNCFDKIFSGSNFDFNLHKKPIDILEADFISNHHSFENIYNQFSRQHFHTLPSFNIFGFDFIHLKSSLYIKPEFRV